MPAAYFLLPAFLNRGQSAKVKEKMADNQRKGNVGRGSLVIVRVSRS